MLRSEASFQRTVIVLLAAGFGALILVAGASIWLSDRGRAFSQRALEAQELKTVTGELLSAVQDVETGQRGFLLTENPAFLEPHDRGRRELPNIMAAFTRLAGPVPEMRDYPARLGAMVARKLALSDRALALHRAGDRQAAAALVRTGEGKAVMDEVRAVVREAQVRQDQLQTERARELDSATGVLLAVNLVGLVLVLVLGAASMMAVRRYIRHLNEARTALQGINDNLEQAVAERAGEVLRANEEIQRFAHIVSHDLRAPLVNIMGFTSELESIGKNFAQQLAVLADKAPELALPETVETVKTDLPEAIGFIRASSSKMDRLINAILKLSREGRRALAPTRVAMGDLARSIAGSVQHQLAAAEGEIVIGSVPDLITDRLAIEQVFSNLVDNAVKYLQPGRKGLIGIDGDDEGAYVVYRVRDNGRGIDPKDFERVFELFRRAGAQDQPGEGLGLAFVRTLVRRLGGTIDVNSEPGQGTVFTLRFPKILTVKEAPDS